MRLPKIKYLSEILATSFNKAGYEIIHATGGWHLHKDNIYCGNLQYKGAKGWQGSALPHLPREIIEQLKKIKI